jgi:hypothetical protein
LDAEKTYYWYVDAGDTITFGVTASKPNPSLPELKEGTPQKLSANSGYYTFKPDEEKKYYFYIDGEDFGYALYNDSGNLETENEISVHTRCFSAVLDEGATYYLSLNNYSEGDITVGVTATRPELSKKTITEGEYVESIDGDATYYYKFEPQENGMYYFYLDTKGSTYRYLLYNSDVEEQETQSIFSTYDNSFAYNCNKGETYYVAVVNRTYEESDVTIKIASKLEQKVSSIDIGTEQKVTIGVRDTNYYQFTTTDEGNYYFYAQGKKKDFSKLKMTLYSQDAESISSTRTLPTIYTQSYAYKLDADTTYYVEIKSSKWEEINLTFAIVNTMPKIKAQTLTLDTEEKLTDVVSGNSEYYSFTPEITGTYYFYSSGIKCRFYDNELKSFNGKYISRSKYSSYSLDLTEGTTYYINLYSGSSGLI